MTNRVVLWAGNAATHEPLIDDPGLPRDSVSEPAPPTEFVIVPL